jgi:hypothetical protein
MHRSSVVYPDPHHFGNVDPDPNPQPHQDDKSESGSASTKNWDPDPHPDPHQSDKSDPDPQHCIEDKRQTGTRTFGGLKG